MTTETVQGNIMSDKVPIINRIAAVVQPKESYLAWARALDDDDPSIDAVSRENLTSVYLIEEKEDDERVLRKHWAWIFEENLHSWHRDRQAWPRRRTYQVFCEWFDVRLVRLVFDLVDGPIVHEES